MSVAQIDAAAVKAQQREAWDAISTGWATSLDQFERGAAAMTARLLELSMTAAGQRVLDVATGLGEPALSAARVVGPTGSVVGVDISPQMLAVAGRRAAVANLSNVDFWPADLESIDLPAHSFDVALSRWGLMFAVDHVAAFRAIARLLVPGGALAAAVWGPPAGVPMMSLAFAVLSERLELRPPPPGMPGPFSMADPVQLAAELATAGFTDVSIEEFVVPFRLDSPRAYVEFSKAVTPPALLRVIRERYGTVDHPAAWRAVEAAVEPYGVDGGAVALPSTALTVRAVASEYLLS
jgi:ubiquinone/menaquinone biosynthesis C-methylase UbiE